MTKTRVRSLVPMSKVPGREFDMRVVGVRFEAFGLAEVAYTAISTNVRPSPTG